MTTIETERIVGCCGFEAWGRVIAWLQIILNGLSILMAILTLVGVSQDNNMGSHPGYTGAVITILAIALLLSLVGILFGIILLKGVNESRPSYLKAWILFTTLLILWTVLAAALGRSGINIWIRLTLVLLQVLIYSFGIWIVYSLKKDIESKIPVVIEKNF